MGYIPPRCAYELDDGRVRTDGSVRGRISGTSLSAVLGRNPWTTPFRAACAMLGIGSEDISDKPAVKAGRALETPLIRFGDGLMSGMGMRLIPAEELFAKREGDHDAWPSDFDDEVFAGHLDGLVEQDGEVCVLEVKTASDPTQWVDGVPGHYRDQVMLYSRFMCPQADHAWVLVGFTDSRAQADPISWKPATGDDGNVALIRVEITEEDKAVFEQDLDRARAWYDEHIAHGVTPRMDPLDRGDAEMWAHLESLTAGRDGVCSKLERYERVKNEIADGERAMKSLYDEAESLKEAIRDWMTTNDVSEVEGGSLRAVVSETRTRELDAEAFLRDGLDPDKYTRQRVSRRLTFKKRQ